MHPRHIRPTTFVNKCQLEVASDTPFLCVTKKNWLWSSSLAEKQRCGLKRICPDKSSMEYLSCAIPLCRCVCVRACVKWAESDRRSLPQDGTAREPLESRYNLFFQFENCSARFMNACCLFFRFASYTLAMPNTNPPKKNRNRKHIIIDTRLVMANATYLTDQQLFERILSKLQIADFFFDYLYHVPFLHRKKWMGQHEVPLKLYTCTIPVSLHSPGKKTLFTHKMYSFFW